MNSSTVEPGFDSGKPIDPVFGQFYFENFIVGECNRFAYISANYVADNLEKKKATPLFLWGGSGQGKTHLLKAIGNTIHEKHNEKSVVYTTGKDFTEEYCVCLNCKGLTCFRNTYRSADVLLFDDIQLLKGKDRIQSEFYHTIQTLMDSGKQIVVTADRMPGELFSIIEPSIVNLLMSGTMFEIQPPDYDTRKKLVQRLMTNEKTLSDANITKYICENVRESISKLICAINLICCYDSLVQDIDLTQAIWLLRPLISNIPKRRITTDIILHEVADYFGITVDELFSGSRKWKENNHRFVAIAVCNYFPEISMNTIRTLFDNPHINARWIYDFAEDNPTIQDMAEEIIRKLENWLKYID